MYEYNSIGCQGHVQLKYQHGLGLTRPNKNTTDIDKLGNTGKWCLTAEQQKTCFFQNFQDTHKSKNNEKGN